MNEKEIQEKLDYFENNEKKYWGFDMTGYGDSGDDRSLEDNIKCQEKNFKLLKSKFHLNFWDLTWENFYLQFWKGRVWWGDKQARDVLKEFNGWTTAEIIEWLYKNKPYPKPEIARVVTKEKRYMVLKRQKWRYNECGCLLKFSKKSNWEGEIAHIDHIHPFSKKETYKDGKPWLINELENLQALCPKCNKTKYSKTKQ